MYEKSTFGLLLSLANAPHASTDPKHPKLHNHQVWSSQKFLLYWKRTLVILGKARSRGKRTKTPFKQRLHWTEWMIPNSSLWSFPCHHCHLHPTQMYILSLSRLFPARSGFCCKTSCNSPQDRVPIAHLTFMDLHNRKVTFPLSPFYSSKGSLYSSQTGLLIILKHCDVLVSSQQSPIW